MTIFHSYGTNLPEGRAVSNGRILFKTHFPGYGLHCSAGLILFALIHQLQNILQGPDFWVVGDWQSQIQEKKCESLTNQVSPENNLS